MAETISDAHILALFTRGRWVDLERQEGRTLSLEAMARRIDIPEFQLEALIEHGRLASRARPKLLAFSELTESDLANRPGFAEPKPAGEQCDKDDLAAFWGSFGHLFLSSGVKAA